MRIARSTQEDILLSILWSVEYFRCSFRSWILEFVEFVEFVEIVEFVEMRICGKHSGFQNLKAFSFLVHRLWQRSIVFFIRK